MHRRIARTLVVAAGSLCVPLVLVGPAAAAEPPTTGFEDSKGASFTAHENELAFLAAVDATSDRVTVTQIATTEEGRPLHLVAVGDPAPRTAAEARGLPTTLYVCSQHGNEPAGREACLKDIRDLAFTTDAAAITQMQNQVILFVPTANPDGRAANSRTNSLRIDINRDHLTLESTEAQAIGRVIRDWQPDLSIDLHEYGPGQPVLYDDDVLYLWPRNLNVDQQVHDRAKAFAEVDVVDCSNDAGYSADVYGISAAGPIDVTQTAGDEDEGIMRNAMGLRHSLGILIETAVSPKAGTEVIDSAENKRRRVASHQVVSKCGRDYMAASGPAVALDTAGSAQRKTVEGAARSAPLYLAGADNDPATASETVNPPPCGFDLTAAQAATAATALEIHGVTAAPLGDGLRVLMGQPAEPLLPLLLDDGSPKNRNVVDSTAIADCASAAGDDPVVPEAPFAALLPLSALLAGGVVWALRSRRAGAAA